MRTFVSLFTGVGGMDMGLEDAGWKCQAQVELDPDCQQVLQRRWPAVPKWADVREVSGGELPAADVVAFGSPCQGLSVAGQRAGLDHHESGLFLEAERIIRGMRGATGGARPRVAIWENVAGALSSNAGADFEAVLGHLADCGALAIEWRVLDAAFFGVPQRRRRVFLVAVFDPGLAGAGHILADPGGVPGDLEASEARSPFDPGVAPRCVAFAENTRNELRVMTVAPSLTVGGGKAGRGYVAVLEDGVPRRLTPRERERLMGWPDDWTRWRNDGRENSDTARNRMTGNGVVRPVAAWVARRVDALMHT